MRALRAYNQDPKRPQDTLLRVKAALTTKAASIGIKPKARDEALRCVEIIEMFQRNENALGMRAMNLSEPPDFDMIEIAGVMVSVHPDFLIGGGGSRIGAGMLRVAKAPDPTDCKKENARDRRQHHRRELGHYLVALMQLLLDEQKGELGLPDRDLCFVSDVRLGERIGAATDHAVRIRDIRSACVQIAKLWPTVEAKPYLWNKPT